MAEILVMGEMIIEIMRTAENAPLDKADYFKGPFPSGAPAIFIDTVARLGHKAGIIGGVGNDDFGKCLRDRLEGDGVDISQVMINENVSTGCAFVTYFDDGSRKFIFHIGNTPAAEAKAPKREILEGVKYFHVMGCSLAASLPFAEEILKTVRMAKEMGAKISFDPNVRPELMGDARVAEIIEEILEYTSVFLPGREELMMLMKKDTLEEAVRACMEKENIEILALKKGSKGCTVYTKDDVIKAGVYPITPVDATGAGDSFDGAFICGLLEGRELSETVRMAAAAGVLNTAAFGPMEGKISIENIHKVMKENAMGLVTFKGMMKKAQSGGYAVGAFNVENMEMVKAVLAAAAELKAPVILQTTPSTIAYGTAETYAAIVKAEAEKAEVPVCLHLDHGNSYEFAVRAIEAGYSSVMIDGSKEAFEDNIAIIKKVVEYAHGKGIAVEAELGKMGGKEDDLEAEADTNTDVEEAVEFVARTGVDSLAVAIGTAHGFYQGVPVLNKERLSEIRERVDIPLVLHGASGLSDEEVKECIKRGICKVNFATELRAAYTGAVKKLLEEQPEIYDPKKLGKAGMATVTELVKQRMKVCGC